MTAAQKNKIIQDIIKHDFLKEFRKIDTFKDGVKVEYRFFGRVRCQELLVYTEANDLDFTFNAHEKNIITVNIY